MKRKELIEFLERNRCVLLRHGAKYDIYLNQANGKKQPVPRHSEIDDHLVRHIKKYLGL